MLQQHGTRSQVLHQPVLTGVVESFSDLRVGPILLSATHLVSGELTLQMDLMGLVKHSLPPHQVVWLVGDATAGKSRIANEAVRAMLPEQHL